MQQTGAALQTISERFEEDFDQIETGDLITFYGWWSSGASVAVVVEAAPCTIYYRIHGKVRNSRRSFLKSLYLREELDLQRAEK